jgi:GNAT superfamily N-acetyltransferase
MPDLALEIRAARNSDLEEILRLLARDSFTVQAEDENGRSHYLEAFDAIAAAPDNQLVVATLGDEVVGTLQLTFIPGLTHRGGWRAQVEGVRVRDDLRNLRIGTRLMEWVIARARERHCRLVQLTTNLRRIDAQRFYQRLGFTPSHVGMKLYL